MVKDQRDKVSNKLHRGNEKKGIFIVFITYRYSALCTFAIRSLEAWGAHAFIAILHFITGGAVLARVWKTVTLCGV